MNLRLQVFDARINDSSSIRDEMPSILVHVVYRLCCRPTLAPFFGF
jgi:hypothetical protein